MLFGFPIWVILCVVFIFLSGYMAFRAMKAEQSLEQEHIEREGQVYLKRMEQERERKKKAVVSK
ncbi:sporulation YhaL family protein [Halobacillus sp. ACCC02827]|uniref:sporulation YhaL family protein n=1 Tax=Bacillaceae TaxID=186817 RepID=UPI0002A4D819|nr:MULTISPECIES: sporulation YhaL family protein [Bacillaceae]ELK47653.1 hypothetical protein D479_06135 [Halobacillus sp. BAB-2008]QHT45963.1 SigE-dependent sporulation protein [Bacillus sp. SB49]WJE16775.1 sporulation YhaL family protein [Halobacillus sp. ACCC02827]